MTVDATVVQAVYGLSSATGPLLAYVVWRHRDNAGALPLLASTGAAWWWSTALFVATLVSDYTISLWLNHVVFLGVGAIVAAVFLFALEYTGREHLVTRRTVALLSIHPLAIFGLAVANPRNLFYSSVARDPSVPTGVYFEFGPAFWVHTLYSYALILLGTVFIVGMLYRSRALYHGQVVALLAALVAPTIGNLVSTARVVPFDTTPVGFVVANALFTVAIVRYQLIDLSPIARDRVVDEISDAVFVVDGKHRLIDVNRTGERFAERVLGTADVAGESVEDLLAPVPEAREGYREIVGGEEARQIELSVLENHYSVNASPLDDGRGRRVGWLFLVRDVTERKRREEELRRRNEQLDQFASVVSHDLRNPLGIAKGYVELVEETGEVELLGEVEEAHRRMEVIIEDVLALAREGSVVTDPAPVALRGVTESAWGTSTPTAPRSASPTTRPSPPTGTACSASSRTCSATRSNTGGATTPTRRSTRRPTTRTSRTRPPTAPPPSRSPSAAARGASTSRTTASGSPRKAAIVSSRAATPAATAPGSGCRSSSRSPRPTAGGCR